MRWPGPARSLGSLSMADELYLIDGNSLAYRAFFALPESIATSTGLPDQRDLRVRVDAREAA